MQHQTETIISTIDDMDANAYVTRQDIINFPFPYKLWLVVHLEHCDFLRWNRDGTVVLLDLVALEDYLNSTRSIFKIKNRSIFLEHLQQFKFERLNATPEAEEDLLLQYKNDNFQRHRLDLLAKIRRRNSCTGAFQLEAAVEIVTAASTAQGRVVDRMLGDLCFMSHGALSNIQKSRLRFQTTLNFQNETRILQQKLQASDEHAAAQLHQRRFKADMTLARINSAAGAAPAPPPAPAALEEEQVIELPVELFENPHDSVLHLGEDFRPEYAGYYGNCSKNQIMHFFGDYLPMYEDGSMEVKKIVAEVGAQNHYVNAVDMEQHFEQKLAHADEEDHKMYIVPQQQIPAKSMPTFNLSSSLEPIFKRDDEEDDEHVEMMNQQMNIANNNNNIADIELELSMDEFIKFKDNSNSCCSSNNNNNNSMSSMNIKQEQLLLNSEEFPQMPSAVKMEITDEEDSENEANFRNFFSQYRASLNLLYERH